MAQGGEHLAHTANRECIWGARNGHAGEIAGKVVQNMIQYLKEHPANYQGRWIHSWSFSINHLRNIIL